MLEDGERTMAAGASNRARLQQMMRDLRLDWLIVSSFETVCYATGFVENIEVGGSPFAGGPTLAFVSKEGDATLVTATRGNADLAVAVETYKGYDWEEEFVYEDEYRAAIARVAESRGIGGRIGVEARSSPLALDAVINATWVPVDLPLARIRCIKSPDEVDLLTRAAETARQGQMAALACSRPGISELDAFASIRAAMESYAGGRLAVAGDYLTGVQRTSAATGWPGTRVIEAGDPVICDLAPRVSGYWGDSCGSFAIGEASATFRKLFQASQEALATALDIMRPGLAFSELDRRLRAVVTSHGFSYPHHSGHSIGTSVHEWPRIVPYEAAVLERDMVLMVEPSAYDRSGGGVRLEWMIHVEEDGCRPLAPFEHRLHT